MANLSSPSTTTFFFSALNKIFHPNHNPSSESTMPSTVPVIPIHPPTSVNPSSTSYSTSYPHPSASPISPTYSDSGSAFFSVPSPASAASFTSNEYGGPDTNSSLESFGTAGITPAPAIGCAPVMAHQRASSSSYVNHHTNVESCGAINDYSGMQFQSAMPSSVSDHKHGDIAKLTSPAASLEYDLGDATNTNMTSTEYNGGASSSSNPASQPSAFDGSNYITWSPPISSKPEPVPASSSSQTSIQNVGSGSSKGRSNQPLDSGSHTRSSSSHSSMGNDRAPSMTGSVYIPSPSSNSSGNRFAQHEQAAPNSAASIHSPVPSHAPQPAHASTYPQQIPYGGQPQIQTQDQQPILFDVDLDDWQNSAATGLRYPQNSISASTGSGYPAYVHRPSPNAQPPHPATAQPSHQSHLHALALNLNPSNVSPPYPPPSSASPASSLSSLSSLSPNQIPLPLTPGHEMGHGLQGFNAPGLGLVSGGLPLAPLSGNTSSPTSGRPMRSSPSPLVSNQMVAGQRRGSLAIAPSSPSPSIPSTSPSSFHAHHRSAYHPYASARSQHGQQRPSPLHQQHFEWSVAGEGGKVAAGDESYAGAYDKMYKERQRQQQVQRMYAQDEQYRQQQALMEQRRHSVPSVLRRHAAGTDGSPTLHATHQGQPRKVYPSPPPSGSRHIPSSYPSQPVLNFSYSTSQSISARAVNVVSPPNAMGAPNQTLEEELIGDSNGYDPQQQSQEGQEMVDMGPVMDVDQMSMGMGMELDMGMSIDGAAFATGMGYGADDGSMPMTGMASDINMGYVDAQSYMQSHQVSMEDGRVSNPGISPQMTMSEDFSTSTSNTASSTMASTPFTTASLTVSRDLDTQHGSDLKFDLDSYSPQSPTVVGVVPDWQKAGGEYDSADSSSESDSDDEDGERNEHQKLTADGQWAQQQSTDAHQVATKKGRKGRKLNASTGAAVGQGKKRGRKPKNASAISIAAKKPLANANSNSTPPGSATTGQRAKPEIAKRTSVASTRTIRARSLGARAKASTQTLTPKTKDYDGGDLSRLNDELLGGDEDAEGEDEIPSGDAARMGADDSEGEIDADADGEDVANGDEDEDLEEDELSESSEDSEDWYDDEKDGEFVLRPRRSRSKSANAGATALSRGSSRRNPDGKGGKRGSASGRTLRSRSTNGLSGRYNPYSVYAASAALSAGGDATNSGDLAQVAGMRTLSASLANAGVSVSGVGMSCPIDIPSLDSDSSLHLNSLPDSKPPGGLAIGTSAGDDVDGGMAGLSTSVDSANGRRRPRPMASLPVPVPVPNLTKKSRGRRVPTVNSLEELRKVAAVQANGSGMSSGTSGGRKGRGSNGGTKGARMYLCDVEGCGKCFARGEHLKRHVRSIHTNEKPHTCPYPGCGKDFSRHDNLGQHMRVHKDYVPPPSLKA